MKRNDMYEAHRKHIDVHYIMEGIEKIATADVKNLQEKVPFDKDKDIGFYEGCESGSYYFKTRRFYWFVFRVTHIK